MSNTIRLFFILVAAVFAVPALAQTLSPQEVMLAKKWKLAYYEAEGERIDPTPDQRNDVMDIRKDRTVVSIESGGTQHGTWTYEDGRKELVVVDSASKDRMGLRVAALDSARCTLEFKDPDGVLLRMHMVPF